MNERLTTKDMSDALSLHMKLENAGSRLIVAHQQVAELHAKVKVFEAVVWFPRLQAVVIGSDYRGMSGKFRDIKIMTWCCAGRCLIQFEKGENRITLITSDNEKPWSREMAHVAPNMGPMGIQGIESDFVEALSMLYIATRYGDEIELKDDDAVSIG